MSKQRFWGKYKEDSLFSVFAEVSNFRYVFVILNSLKPPFLTSILNCSITSSTPKLMQHNHL